DVHESWLGAARLTSRGDDPAFVDYLISLFADRTPNLVIAVGSPAATFLETYRQGLFSSTPGLLTLVELPATPRPKPNQVAVPYAGRDRSTIENILRILPQTKNLVIVIGNSPIERHSIEDLDASARAFRDRLNVTVLSAVRTFDDLLN